MAQLQYTDAERQQFADELHRARYKPKETRQVIVFGPNDTFGFDLADMTEDYAKKYNDGYRYLFLCMDIFSRYVWAVPLRTKDKQTTFQALKDVLEKSGVPRKVWVDEGGEFVNSKWDGLFKKLGIPYYHTHSPYKVAHLERLNRTLKGWTFKRFTRDNTKRWIDFIDEIVHFYNHRKHSALGMSPAEARNPENTEALMKKQYGEFFTEQKVKFGKSDIQVGDYVRLSRIKGQFERGFDENWTKEAYRVIDIDYQYPVMYHLAEWDGTPIEGAFYRDEIQKSKVPLFALIDNDHVKECTYKGKKQIYVKWLGWDKKYATWMDKDKAFNLH